MRTSLLNKTRKDEQQKKLLSDTDIVERDMTSLYSMRMILYRNLKRDLFVMRCQKQSFILNGQPFDEDKYDSDKTKLIDKYKKDVYVIDKNIERLNSKLTRMQDASRRIR